MYDEIYNEILEKLKNSEVNEKHINDLLSDLYEKIKQYDYESAYGYELYESDEYSNVFDDNGNWAIEPYSVAKKFSTRIDKNVISKLENENNKILIENLKLKTLAKFNDRNFLSNILKHNEVLENHLKNKDYIVDFVKNNLDVIEQRNNGTYLLYEKLEQKNNSIKNSIEDSKSYKEVYENKKIICEQEKKILENKFIYKVPFVKSLSKKYNYLKNEIEYYNGRIDYANSNITSFNNQLEKARTEFSNYKIEHNIQRYESIDFISYDSFLNIYYIYEEDEVCTNIETIEKVFTLLEEEIIENADKCNYVRQLIKEIDIYCDTSINEYEEVVEYEEMEL